MHAACRESLRSNYGAHTRCHLPVPQSVLKSIAISGEESDESLLEGLLTLALHYPESGFAKLEVS